MIEIEKPTPRQRAELIVATLTSEHFSYAQVDPVGYIAAQIEAAMGPRFVLIPASKPPVGRFTPTAQ